jgi:hypothetical protein
MAAASGIAVTNSYSEPPGPRPVWAPRLGLGLFLDLPLLIIRLLPQMSLPRKRPQHEMVVREDSWPLRIKLHLF